MTRISELREMMQRFPKTGEIKGWKKLPTYKQKAPVFFAKTGAFFMKKVLFSFPKTKETLGNPAQFHRIYFLSTQKPLGRSALNKPILTSFFSTG